jgi:hypothetical protein
MNSTPAARKASRILSPVSLRPPSGPSFASNRFIVGIEIFAAAANSSCDQAKRARAALIWRIDTFGIDLIPILEDTFSIEKASAENFQCLNGFPNQWTAYTAAPS